MPGSTGQALLNPPPHSALISPGVQQVQPILPKAFVHSQLSRSCQEDSLLPAQPVPGAGVAAELPRGHRGRFLTGLHRGCRGRNSLQPEPREPGSVHAVPRSSNTLKNLHENQNPSEPKFSSSFLPWALQLQTHHCTVTMLNLNQKTLLAQVGHFPAHSRLLRLQYQKKYRTFQNHIILRQIFQTVLNNKSKENETFVGSHE